MAKLRGTKLRALTRSGDEPKVLPSRSRPHKPPAKAISARKAAGMKIGGGKIPPSRRANVPAPDPGTRRDKMARLATKH